MRDLYWAAGFIEGEGCFHLVAGTQAGIMVSQKTIGPLERLQKIFHCGTIYRQPKGQLQWRVYSRRAIAIMMTLYSLMSKRRQQKIEEILTIWKCHKYKYRAIQWDNSKRIL